MPRFENEDFDPKHARNDVDRTVPKDEDYYNYSPMDVDLDFNSKRKGDDIVVDNQRRNEQPRYQAKPNDDISFKSET